MGPFPMCSIFFTQKRSLILAFYWWPLRYLMIKRPLFPHYVDPRPFSSMWKIFHSYTWGFFVKDCIISYCTKTFFARLHSMVRYMICYLYLHSRWLNMVSRWYFRNRISRSYAASFTENDYGNSLTMLPEKQTKK